MVNKMLSIGIPLESSAHKIFDIDHDMASTLQKKKQKEINICGQIEVAIKRVQLKR